MEIETITSLCLIKFDYHLDVCILSHLHGIWSVMELSCAKYKVFNDYAKRTFIFNICLHHFTKITSIHTKTNGKGPKVKPPWLEGTFLLEHFLKFNFLNKYKSKCWVEIFWRYGNIIIFKYWCLEIKNKSFLTSQLLQHSVPTSVASRKSVSLWSCFLKTVQ